MQHHYKVIKYAMIHDLISGVNDSLLDGYLLAGGVCVVQEDNSRYTGIGGWPEKEIVTVYMQAMYKEETGSYTATMEKK